MQVSAYKIVEKFGIEALSSFYNIDTAEEIQKARDDWAAIHAKSICLVSFNDGNNIYDVILNLETMKVYRNDYGTDDVTEQYAEKAVAALDRLDKVAGLFGVSSSFVLNFIKSNCG